MIQLPVSGIDIFLRLPAGTEELLLLESYTVDTSLALALIERVAYPAGAPVAWPNLPVTDLDVLVLRLRQLVFGETAIVGSFADGGRSELERLLLDWQGRHPDVRVRITP